MNDIHVHVVLRHMYWICSNFKSVSLAKDEKSNVNHTIRKAVSKDLCPYSPRSAG